jgi:hypothetical protein
MTTTESFDPPATGSPDATYDDVTSPMFCGPQQVDVVW